MPVFQFPDVQVQDPDFARRVRDSFDRQTIMGLIGARLTRVEPGEVEIELPFRDDLCQQHGFFHAGVTSTIADSAGGYAAFSLFPADASVLTVEFKINLLAPADGDLLRAVGRVVKPGRTLTVTEAEVLVVKDGREKACARMTQTLMCLTGRPDMPQAG
ncbi:PaaI family thioesterase [Pelagibius sp. CAU 1746]|uniref:PaaI family thioesterase n=1 Tax=Pelagibius sp. CAU 1746 TaxID=3140370 RepID=UPI00325B1C17